MKSLPIQIDKRSSWSNLKAEYVLPVSERPNFYCLDLVTAYKTEKSGFWQDFGHAWIRLITPKGEVMSIGYFPDETTNVVPEKRPGLRFPGILLHPDKYNALRFKEKVTRIVVQEEKFIHLINWLVKLQTQRDKKCLPFSLVDLNCVWFVVEAARQAGVQVDAHYSLRRAIMDFIRQQFNMGSKPYRAISTAPHLLARIIFNMGLAILGGCRYHKYQWIENETKERFFIQHSDLRPIFMNWHDIFSKPVHFYHVRSLRQWQSVNPETIFSSIKN
jgi:hypothetical protein